MYLQEKIRGYVYHVMSAVVVSCNKLLKCNVFYGLINDLFGKRLGRYNKLWILGKKIPVGPEIESPLIVSDSFHQHRLHWENVFLKKLLWCRKFCNFFNRMVRSTISEWFQVTSFLFQIKGKRTWQYCRELHKHFNGFSIHFFKKSKCYCITQSTYAVRGNILFFYLLLMFYFLVLCLIPCRNKHLQVNVIHFNSVIDSIYI